MTKIETEVKTDVKTTQVVHMKSLMERKTLNERRMGLSRIWKKL